LLLLQHRWCVHVKGREASYLLAAIHIEMCVYRKIMFVARGWRHRAIWRAVMQVHRPQCVHDMQEEDKEATHLYTIPQGNAKKKLHTFIYLLPSVPSWWKTIGSSLNVMMKLHTFIYLLPSVPSWWNSTHSWNF
jgi:hypothetical protein